MVLLALLLLGQLKNPSSAIRRVELGGDEVFLARWFDGRRLLLSRRGKDRPVWVWRDVRTRREMPLRLWGDAHPPSSLDPSPDGERLMWSESRPLGGDDMVVHVTTARLDGTQKQSARLGHINSHVLWAPDSRSWIEIPAHSGPGDVKVLRHDVATGKVQAERWGPLDKKYATSFVVGLPPRGTLLISSDWRGLAPVIQTFHVLETNAGGSRLRPRVHRIRMPPNAHIWAQNDDAFISFNRQGDRVAFFLKRDRQREPTIDSRGPALTPEQRAFAGRRLQERLREPYELWVGDLRGRGMRRLATLSFRYDPVRSYATEPADLQWMPDGRHVSYRHMRTMYVFKTD